VKGAISEVIPLCATKQLVQFYTGSGIFLELTKIISNLPF